MESTFHMFPDVETAALCETVGKHLKTLEQRLPFYFPSASTDCLDWFRDPYSPAAVVDLAGAGGNNCTETRSLFKAELC